MTRLAEKSCIPCSGTASPVSDEETNRLLEEIPDWEIIEENNVKKLHRNFTFKNFVQALEFTNKVGALAEDVNHHPTLVTEWGKVSVTWWSHAIKGLHETDFIMAARTDDLFQKTA